MTRAWKVLPALDAVISQSEFARILGVSDAAVSHMVADGLITPRRPAREWLLAVFKRYREQAAGRQEEAGPNVADARMREYNARAEAQELKNKILREEYAPVGLLADLLGASTASMVDRIEGSEGKLQKVLPDAPEAMLAIWQQLLVDCRNDWAAHCRMGAVKLFDALEAKEGSES